MACYTKFPVVSTILKLNIKSNLHTGYKHNFYHDKRERFDETFDKFHFPLLKDIYNSALIQERKQNIDDAAYEKS